MPDQFDETVRYCPGCCEWIVTRSSVRECSKCGNKHITKPSSVTIVSIINNLRKDQEILKNKMEKLEKELEKAKTDIENYLVKGEI